MFKNKPMKDIFKDNLEITPIEIFLMVKDTFYSER